MRREFYEKAFAPLWISPLMEPPCYNAFVLDLDGNNLEAVCHLPE